ncbi:MAG: hypothetical protein LBD98_03265 [Endomicrobium sp.]|jgi:hypothetical protein|nr:hypothetical protein [Endomicrobium sp.]
MEKIKEDPAKYPEIMPEGLAKVFYESKIFKDVQSEAQAIVKILAGREMGLSPIQSMNTVYILDSKIGYETKVFLSKLKKSEKYDYEVTFTEKDAKVESATVDFFKVTKKDDPNSFIGSSQFSIYDAARIGLINKTSYKNYPKLMLFYRAASNGIKMFCPEILDGAALVEDYIELMPSTQEVEVSLKGEEIKVGEIDEQKGT